MSDPVVRTSNVSTRKILVVIFTLVALVLGIIVMLTKVTNKDWKYYVGGAIVALCLALTSLLL
jgi:hypothetical protein